MNDASFVELETDALENVAGGNGIGMGLQRGYVNSLKNLHANPNQADGQVVNSLRPHLPDAVAARPRPWIGGSSINSLSKDMMLNGMSGFPANRLAR